MDIADLTIDLIKYIFAGCVVVGVANWMFWTKYNNHTFRLKAMEARQTAKKEALPLRLQAYERLVLLVERINPENLLLRLHRAELDSAAFQQLLVEEIRSEFQHNITQQLYVSDAAWSTVKQLKTNTVALIRNVGTGLPETATAKELSSIILTHIAELGENPYELAIRTIKNELAR